ncbi:caspase, EACC1-associated type [Nonomuraea wenchangensis]|uniref:caspase, EACC1-associated type n=1 Tax=Nonomuraea wenchangensis TaxID=568860 RepID=UPI00343EFB07
MVRSRWNGPPLLLASDGARAVVAGTGAHQPASRLPVAPAVPATVGDLGRCLVERAGLAPAHLTVLVDPATPAVLGEALERAAREATSVLLFHYSGHGIFTPDGELHLATRATVDLAQGAPGHQALPFSVVRQMLAGSAAELAVVVLDCCFTGGGRPVPARAMDRVFEGMGRAYVLASASRDVNGWALPGVRHTALGGALLRLLSDGDPDGPAAFTLDQVHHRLARALPAAGFPRPRRAVTGNAANAGASALLAPNPAHRPAPAVPVPAAAAAAAAGEATGPYRGLAAYGVEHAELFCGREALVRALTERVRGAGGDGDGGIVVVTGPSGCGKSSVLRAGLVPAFRTSRGEGPAGVVVLAPGADPLGALARELAALGGGDPVRLRAVIESDPGAAARALPSGPVLVVVDPFEEVFTECAEPAGRRRFVAALGELARAAAVVVSVRSEHFGACAAYPELVAALRRPEVVPPPGEAELRAMIEEPAARCGLRLEAGLADLVLEELRAYESELERSGGTLPLLSHALLATWERRSGNVLAMADYRASGGVAGAVAASAEEALRALGPEFEAMARELLLRMVRTDGVAGPAGRRVPLATLTDGGSGEAASVRAQVLAGLARSRLVRVHGGEAGLVHDALIRAWPRLGGWVDAERAATLVRRRLAEDARRWEREGRDPGQLYADTRLAAAIALTGTPLRPAQPSLAGTAQGRAGDGGALPAVGSMTVHGKLVAAGRRPARRLPLTRSGAGGPDAAGEGLSGVERAFLLASGRRQRRRASIGRAVMAALSVLVLAAATGAVLQWRAAGQAVRQERQVAAQRDAALSRQVAASAAALPDAAPAAQLALAAYRLSATPEARGALLGALSRPIPSRLLGHSGPVERVVYRPDGQVLATVSGDRTARLWNVADPLRPKSAGVVTGHTAGLTGAAFSPEGKVLATASADGTARLWDVATPTGPKPLGTLKGHEGPVLSVAAAPKGGLLATAGADRTVRLWDVAAPASPKAVAVLRQPSEPADVAFSPDGRMVAVTSATGVTLLDVLTPATPTTLAAFASPDGGAVRSVAFSPDGRSLAAGAATGALHLWNIAAAKLTGTAAGAGVAVEDVAFSPDGNVLAAASADGAVRLWDVATLGEPQPAAVLTAPGGAAGVAFSPDGRTLAAAGGDGVARLWNVADPARVAARARLGRHTARVNAVAVAKGGGTLATVSDDKTVKLWDIGDPAAATPVSTLRGHTGAVEDVAFSPDDRYVVSAALDGTARLWEVARPANPKFVATMQGPASGMRSVAYAPGGKLVAAIGGDGRTQLWDVSTPAAPRRVATPGAADGRLDALAFRPDGKVLATGSGTASVRLWEVSKPAAPRLLADLAAQPGGVLGLRFAPDGRTLATTGADGAAALWDVAAPERPKRLALLRGHTGPVTAAAFGADGRTLVTASRDRTLRVWNVADRARPSLWAVLAGPEPVDDVAVTPDGVTLAATSGAAVQLWGLDTEQAAATVCERAGAAITREEWAQYVPGRPYALPCPATG